MEQNGSKQVKNRAGMVNIGQSKIKIGKWVKMGPNSAKMGSKYVKIRQNGAKMGSKWLIIGNGRLRMPYFPDYIFHLDPFLPVLGILTHFDPFRPRFDLLLPILTRSWLYFDPF